MIASKNMGAQASCLLRGRAGCPRFSNLLKPTVLGLGEGDKINSTELFTATDILTSRMIAVGRHNERTTGIVVIRNKEDELRYSNPK